jgi:phospho-N-acetylmuramoyl-pentapeptide-transferase
MYSLDINYVDSAIFAFFTSFFINIFFGKYIINLLGLIQKTGQPIREDGIKEHIISKTGTKTLGGVLILLTFFTSVFIWVHEYNHLILGILFATLFFFILGLADDLLKIYSKSSKGLSGKLRLLLGFAFSIYISYYISQDFPKDITTSFFIPIDSIFNFKLENIYHLNIVYYFLIGFILVGTANSVNLTDGLDGLASLISATVLATLFILLIILINTNYHTNYITHSLVYYNKILEIPVLIAALIGAILGFLWFNSFKAEIFMGDCGSLMIGGAIATIAYSFKYELMLILLGFIFILETLSVIFQVYFFKMTKKRMFLMAPLHHHYEKKGLHENKILIRFWLITVVCCIFSLYLVY